jgi:hypothetical protein
VHLAGAEVGGVTQPRAVVVASPGALYHWRELAAAKVRADTAGDRRAACLAMMANAGTAPFSWDYPIEGGTVQFTWTCPGCGDVNGGRLSTAARPPPGHWVNTGSQLAPSLEPALECGTCTTVWRLRDGCYALVRRTLGSARRRHSPG